jgi:glycerol-3-phosphate acyltransferase PlsY
VHIWVYLAIGILGYLLGSIPTGFLVAKARGIDIRSVGSGNIGATNAFRILGNGPGAFVLVADAVKGVAACAGLPWLAGAMGLIDAGATSDSMDALRITGGIASILGHNYTCWLGFKGGKGIATSAGVLAALVPWAFLIVLAVFLGVFGISRYVSLGSITAAAVLPIATWFTHGSATLVGVTVFMALLAIYKHRANIRRLLQGTENRVGARGKEAAP